MTQENIIGTRFGDMVALQAETWSGIARPNEAAGVLAEELMNTIKSFQALRGQLRFEDEPSSFEAALQDTKEVVR